MSKKRFITDAAPCGDMKVKYITEEQVLGMRAWEEDEAYAIKQYFGAVRAHEMTNCPTLKYTSEDNLREQLKDILVQYYLYELLRGAGHHLQFAWGVSKKDFGALYGAFCDVWCTFSY